MFEEMFRKYEPIEKGELSRKRVSANKVRVINKIEQTEKIKSARPVSRKWIAVSIAATVSLLTVTAGAAGLSLNELFGKVFGGVNTAQTAENEAEPTAAEGTSVSETEPAAPTENAAEAYNFDFDKHGKKLGLSYDFENVTINIKAIAADDYSAHILYDAVFDKNYEYGYKKDFTEWEISVTADTLEKDGIIMSDTLVEKNDNVFSFYKKLDIKADGKPLAGRTITLDFDSIYRYIPTGSEKDPEPYKAIEALDCDISVEIPIDFDTNEHTREFSFNDDITLLEYKENPDKIAAELTKIIITPFNWRIFTNADTSHFTKGDSYDLVVDFIYKDGKKAETKKISEKSGNNSIIYVGMFETPINTENISAVEIYGKVFELK